MPLFTGFARLLACLLQAKLLVSEKHLHHQAERIRKETVSMLLRNALSGLLAGLIALPMYYMFYSMFSHGFETPVFITALIIGVITFLITTSIAYFIGRAKQKE